MFTYREGNGVAIFSQISFFFPQKKIRKNTWTGSFSHYFLFFRFCLIWWHSVSMHFTVNILKITREFSSLMFKTVRLYQYHGGNLKAGRFYLEEQKKFGEMIPKDIVSYFNCKLLALQVKHVTSVAGKGREGCTWFRKQDKEVLWDHIPQMVPWAEFPLMHGPEPGYLGLHSSSASHQMGEQALYPFWLIFSSVQWG